MSNFKSKTIEIGNVKESHSHSAYFIKEETCKPITSLETSCGCTGANNMTDKILVKYTAPRIPDHLRSSNAGMAFNKTVTVRYTDGSHETLKISGVVVK